MPRRIALRSVLLFATAAAVALGFMRWLLVYVTGVAGWPVLVGAAAVLGLVAFGYWTQRLARRTHASLAAGLCTAGLVLLLLTSPGGALGRVPVQVWGTFLEHHSRFSLRACHTAAMVGAAVFTGLLVGSTVWAAYPKCASRRRKNDR